MALPGEALNVISEGLTRLLSTTLLVLGVAGPHIRSLEVASENLLEVLLAVIMFLRRCSSQALAESAR
jgi:hypothetical protein